MNTWKAVRKITLSVAIGAGLMACQAIPFNILPNSGSAVAAPRTLPSGLLMEYVEVDSGVAGDCKMVGDIDGDGYPDLVVGGIVAEKLNWYRYPDWKKTVIATPNVEFTTDAALGDVDSDGDLDIVVPDGDSGQNLVWFQNPLPDGDPLSGSEWVRREIGATNGWGKDVELADLDGNGLLDVASRNGSQVFLYFQSAPDAWQTVPLDGFQAGEEGMASGDIDQDGDIDLVLHGAWLANPGKSAALNSSSWTAYDIGSVSDTFKAFVIDLNGDGIQDILFSSSEKVSDVSWFTPTSGDPTGDWDEHVILPDLEKAHTLQVADMDLDDDLDVIVAQMHTSSAQEVIVMLNTDGQAMQWEKHVVATGGIHNGVVADIGNDGDYDIFGANWTGNPPVKLWLNRAESFGTWEYKEVTANHELTFGLAFGDVDGDGNQDILSGGFWYHNSGDMMGDWSQSSFPSGMHAVLTTDVDQDDYTDVIAQKDENELALYWLEATDLAGSSWNAVRMGAVERASHDIGAQGYRVDQVEKGGRQEVLISSGNGIYYFRIPDSPDAGNWPRVHIHSNPSDEGFDLADIDGDGSLDLAATTGDSKRVEWYRNPGDGSAEWMAYPLGEFTEALYPDRTAVADLNGDGRQDVIVTEENGEGSGAETFWWERPVDPFQPNWTRHLLVSQGTTNSMDVADMDGDGDPDVILAEHRGDLKLSIWLNDGGNLHEMPVWSGKESHLGARAIDLNGDGRLEIVSIAYDQPQYIHLWMNQGSSAPPPGNGEPSYLPLMPNESEPDVNSENPSSLETAQPEPTNSLVNQDLESRAAPTEPVSSGLNLPPGKATSLGWIALLVCGGVVVAGMLLFSARR